MWLLLLVMTIGTLACWFATPTLMEAWEQLQAGLLLPAAWLGLHEVASGLLLGAYGLLGGWLWAACGGATRWTFSTRRAEHRSGPGTPVSGQVRELWESVLSWSLGALLRLLGARPRLLALTLLDSVAFWLVLATAGLIVIAAALAPGNPLTPHKSWTVMSVFLTALVIAGIEYVWIMSRRFAMLLMLSRPASVALAVVTGPLLILTTLMLAWMWKPVTLDWPNPVTSATGYFESVFPDATAVALPDGSTMAIDQYVQLLHTRHIILDPDFQQQQILRVLVNTYHLDPQRAPALLQRPLPDVLRQALLEEDTSDARAGEGATAAPSATAGIRARNRQLIVAFELQRERQWRDLQQLMTAASHRLALLGSLGLGTIFLLVVALVLPGRSRPLAYHHDAHSLPGRERPRLWRQVSLEQVLAAVLALGWLTWMGQALPPVPVAATAGFPPWVASWQDQLLTWANLHLSVSLLLLFLAALGSGALLRWKSRSLPLR